MGAMGDQAMATLGDADWSEESHMDECDPGAPLDMVAEESTRRYDDFTHHAFVQKLHLQILPNDKLRLWKTPGFLLFTCSRTT